MGAGFTGRGVIAPSEVDGDVRGFADAAQVDRGPTADRWPEQGDGSTGG